MKKIIFSLAMIVAVGALVAGATSAYFSDTETYAANTLEAGTIDISLANKLVTKSVEMPDLKPGMTQWIDFDIHNDGVNPVVLRKRLSNFVFSTGVVSEPECTYQHGTWDGQSCVWATEGDDNDLSKVFTYDMELGTDPSFVLIPQSRNVKLSDVKDLWVPIGVLAPGATLHVKQSYHFDEATANWAQGDTMAFDIDIYAEQRMGTGPNTTRGVVMENKDQVDWYPIIDNTWGLLTYAPSAPAFDYTFRGFGLVPNKEYKLVNWDDSTQTETVIATGTANAQGELTLTGSKDLNKDLHDAKLWVKPTAPAWDNVNTLWEGNLADYDDTDV